VNPRTAWLDGFFPTIVLMERFDAIVVGAGPAGSTAALRLARAGARVLLLDRERFPRDKPCGGGLTERAVKQLPVSVDPVVEDVVDRFELGFRYRSRFERGGERPLVLMTQRRRLDAFLAEEAARAGTDFRDGLRATALELGEQEATCRFDGTAAAASVVIGADGVNGLTAKALGFGDRRHGVALEGNVSYVHAREDRWQGRAVVDLGTVAGGYSWVFPKGDHVNVGVGGWRSEGPRLREHLRQACAGYDLPYERLESVRGFRLPMRQVGEPVVRGRALLVGDAAGLVDPLSGDGIYEALLSSRLAVEAILADDLERYGERLEQELAPLMSASWSAKLAFDRFPRLAFTIARTPPAWRVAERLLRDELPDPRAVRGTMRVPLQALRALAHAAGATATR
jgi:geranylgeranyl reductase family protein